MKRRTATAIILLTSTFLLLVAHRATTDVLVVLPVATSAVDVAQQERETVPSLNLLFVGDIMLGRNVELLMERGGALYPFINTEHLLRSADLTIGNFEGIVSPVHEKAEPMTFKFSIKEEFLGILQNIGFDVLSLANNHSYDYGSSAFSYTKELCSKYALVCGGSPSTLDHDSVHTQVVSGRTVSIIFVHTLYKEPDREVLRALIASSTTQSEIQIAYIHWGEEYALIHNDEQRLLSEFLIDHGIDAVVGHHPHVVQDVGFYNGKPIFYSLGNFIFDQYFSKDVQEMVALNINIGTSTIKYSLIPLTSIMVRSQPSPMGETGKDTLFKRIFADFDALNHQTVSVGEFTAPF
ncbi:MAG: CapA family protein [Candidatus Kaiserbacteria bacterium]|nr:CapA family protein [Candidatus Kaiserbacteria bacterium]